MHPFVQYQITNITDNITELYELCISNKTDEPNYCLKYILHELYEVGYEENEEYFNKLNKAVDICANNHDKHNVYMHCTEIKHQIDFHQLKNLEMEYHDYHTAYQKLRVANTLNKLDRCNDAMEELVDIAFGAFVAYLADQHDLFFKFPTFDSIEEAANYEHKILLQLEHYLTKEEYPDKYPPDFLVLRHIYDSVNKRMEEFKKSYRSKKLPKDNTNDSIVYPQEQLPVDLISSMQQVIKDDRYWAIVFLYGKVFGSNPEDSFYYFNRLEENGNSKFIAADIISHIFDIGPFRKRPVPYLDESDYLWPLVESFKYLINASEFSCKEGVRFFNEFIGGSLFFDDFVYANKALASGKLGVAIAIYERLCMMGFGVAKHNLLVALESQFEYHPLIPYVHMIFDIKENEESFYAQRTQFFEKIEYSYQIIDRNPFSHLKLALKAPKIEYSIQIIKYFGSKGTAEKIFSIFVSGPVVFLLRTIGVGGPILADNINTTVIVVFEIITPITVLYSFYLFFALFD